MSNNQQGQPPTPRPGLLCEDADALEVTDPQGRQTIEKTNDREGLARTLRQNESGPKPTHGPVNG